MVVTGASRSRNPLCIHRRGATEALRLSVASPRQRAVSDIAPNMKTHSHQSESCFSSCSSSINVTSRSGGRTDASRGSPMSRSTARNTGLKSALQETSTSPLHFSTERLPRARRSVKQRILVPTPDVRPRPRANASGTSPHRTPTCVTRRGAACSRANRRARSPVLAHTERYPAPFSVRSRKSRRSRLWSATTTGRALAETLETEDIPAS